jgi:hypothetical protein
MFANAGLKALLIALKTHYCCDVKTCHVSEHKDADGNIGRNSA